MTSTDSLQRLQQILDAYGADDRHWPEDERGRLLDFIADSQVAMAMLQQSRELDLLLDQHIVAKPSDNLRQRILATIPSENPIDRILNWLWPRSRSLIWQPALAVSLTLALGFLFGTFSTKLDSSDGWDEEGMYVMGMYYPEDLEQ